MEITTLSLFVINDRSAFGVSVSEKWCCWHWWLDKNFSWIRSFVRKGTIFPQTQQMQPAQQHDPSGGALPLAMWDSSVHGSALVPLHSRNFHHRWHGLCFYGNTEARARAFAPKRSKASEGEPITSQHPGFTKPTTKPPHAGSSKIAKVFGTASHQSPIGHCSKQSSWRKSYFHESWLKKFHVSMIFFCISCRWGRNAANPEERNNQSFLTRYAASHKTYTDLCIAFGFYVTYFKRGTITNHTNTTLSLWSLFMSPSC